MATVKKRGNSKHYFFLAILDKESNVGQHRDRPDQEKCACIDWNGYRSFFRNSSRRNKLTLQANKHNQNHSKSYVSTITAIKNLF